jgi:ribosomal protein S27E
VRIIKGADNRPNKVRCPVCDEWVQIVYQSPEEEIHCSQCGSVHINEEGRRWVYHGSAYPWREPLRSPTRKT